MVKHYQYVLPVWAYIALINSDLSGLSESDCEALDTFVRSLPVKAYIAPLAGAEELGEVFCNDVTKYGFEDCVLAEFQIRK